ncbi:MAG: hypothetical protein H0X66_17950 [Verrucomicrobia bacterium]|nr:hypothetical protein [Verrucomicrobiota bacterium]
MKKLLLTLALGGAVQFAAYAQIIKQWDFNSPLSEFDGLTTTGTLKPSIGSGTPAQTCGGVGERFGNVSGGNNSDPHSLDNSQWRLGTNLGGDGFPAATVGNKTAGAQFMANTAGYGNIQVTWDQENSATASRYWRVQYTIDGVEWLDHETVITAAHDGPLDTNGNPGTPYWQVGLAADFSATPGVANNANFGFRLVSEFEFTATGSGVEAYVGNRPGANYGTGGTIWLDMVTVSGDDLDPSNQAPTISAINDVTALLKDSIPPIAFTISDAETAAGSLVLSVSSSDTSLINSFSFGGSGENRTLTVTPEVGAIGTTSITILVTDAGGKATESSFYLTVLPPLISHVGYQLVLPGEPLTVAFSITNLPGDPETWIVTGNSSDPDKVTDANLVFGGSGANRTVTITPEAALGDAVVSLVAITGDRQATTNFVVRLLPAHVVAFDFSSVPNITYESLDSTLVATGLTAAPITRGPTLGASSITRGFNANNWNSVLSANDPKAATRANALLGDYFQIAITVDSGFKASLAALDINLRRSAVASAMNYEWQYSFNGFATAGTTIPLRGTVWETLNWTLNQFTYLGRDSGTAPTNGFAPYAYMTGSVGGQGAGNPIPTIDLTEVAELQDIPAGTTVTFRLFGWGNANTVDSNSAAVGRDLGPYVRGTVEQVGGTPATLGIIEVEGGIRISWPASVSGILEGATTLPGNWSDVPQTVNEDDGLKTVTIPTSGDQQFFRLRQ